MEGDAALGAAVLRVTAHPEFASRFKHPVKFNGTDFVETKLSEEDQQREVSKLANSTLHVFLERYGNLLAAEDLRGIGALPAASAIEVQFWLERLQREPLRADRREKQRRARRWAWARREMTRPDGFFSEDEMKRRDAKLFHRIVGRHLDSALKLSAPMQGSLSGYLMQQLERECEAEHSAAVGVPAAGASGGAADASPGEEQEDAFFGDEDDASSGESGDDGGAKRRRTGDAAVTDNAAVRRARFLKAMRDRFVAGREAGFNYGPLDDDSDLDDLAELGRDSEDKYFDDD